MYIIPSPGKEKQEVYKFEGILVQLVSELPSVHCETFFIAIKRTRKEGRNGKRNKKCERRRGNSTHGY